jgi:hypothetical protein
MQLHLVHKCHDESGALTQQHPYEVTLTRPLLAPPFDPASWAVQQWQECKAQHSVVLAVIHPCANNCPIFLIV